MRSTLLVVCAVLAACSDNPPGRTYYQREIEPILKNKCAGNTSGCHATNPDDPFSFAAGNFDVTSFETVQKRRDVLTQFGAYPFPLLLIKAVGPTQLKMQYGPVFKSIDVQHVGGGILDVGSDSFFTLQTWLENGASESGLRAATPAKKGTGDCSTAIPAGFDKSQVVTLATEGSFDQFVDHVQPMIREHGCAAGSCHGAPQSDFYITCGDDDTQKAFNFSQARKFVNDPVDDSQLLRIPLAYDAGGRGHTGGDQFSGLDDKDYQALRDWAKTVGDPIDFSNGDPVKTFFATNIQPLLLQRGCQFQACHSASAANDFKLRTGTPGFVSAVAMQKNYDLLRNNFMALEFPDARRGRAVAKTVLANDDRVTTIAGIAHRGGAVLESPDTVLPADPATCPETTAFCTFQEWLRQERAALGNQVTSMNPGDPAQIVYVERTPGSATAGRLEFDEFHGGADLRVTNGNVTYGAGQAITPIDVNADTQSLLGNCTELTAGTSDIGKPNVANDGTRIVFAGRATQADPWGVFMVHIDGTQCQRVTPKAAGPSNGILVHDFDPVFSPDGKFIVFASTRGKMGVGATKSRKRFLPQSDIWRVAVNGDTVDQNSYRQMTFLSNSEVSPAFMREGRITMTTEKVSQGFYQLSGRRINFDGSDYHPLLAQRKDSLYADPGDLMSTHPSVGYASATDIREASDGDFMVILSDVGTDGAPSLKGGGGALALFNRSIGPFEAGRGDTGYLPSMRIIGDPNATGHAGATASYRHPFSMPDGTIMVAYASQAANTNFEIFAVDPRDQAKTRSMFTGNNGKIRVDAVLAYKYPARELYLNHRQLVFGGSVGDGGDKAILHMPDAAMTFTLLTGNLRRGRPVDAFRGARFLAVYSEGLCPAGGCSPGSGGIFENRSLLGTADIDSDDGSVRVQLPSSTGIVLELQDGNKKPIVTMGEEHQLGPGESISMGVSEKLFNGVCGGCHGSVTGKEVDIAVTADALTGASQSASSDRLDSVGN